MQLKVTAGAPLSKTLGTSDCPVEENKTLSTEPLSFVAK